jgi:8-oxo-dGTP pyrophosphatase MutT (NUDIX family)
MDREAALRALGEEHGIDPSIVPANYSGEEDLVEILEAGDYLAWDSCFAAVTSASEYRYVKVYETFAKADRAATENLADSIFAESPVEIVDLDTGKKFLPVVGWKAEGEDDLLEGPPDPPEDLREAWERFQRGEEVSPGDLRRLDEWRADAREDALGW